MQAIIEKIQRHKVIAVISSMLLFSILYMFISDNEWYGVNRIKDIVKDEVTRDKVGDDIEKGNVVAIEGFSEFFAKIDETDNNMVEEIDKVELQVLNELDKKSINKSIFEYYFNRLYFSIVTGCLLGYGDIYPMSIRLKGIVSIQSLLTIIIIVL